MLSCWRAGDCAGDDGGRPSGARRGNRAAPRCAAGLGSGRGDCPTTPARRIILATNIAETSFTVPGVRVVVDTGSPQSRPLRSGPRRSTASNRADFVRLGGSASGTRSPPGAWHRRPALERSRQAAAPPRDRRFTASISRARCSTSLPGAATRAKFGWFERPPTKRSGWHGFARATWRGRGWAAHASLGARLQRIPLHPRLARLLLEARGSWRPRLGLRGSVGAPLHSVAHGDDDERSRCRRWSTSDELPPHVLHTARALQHTSGIEASAAALDERSFRRAVFHAYPDRVGRRRQPARRASCSSSGHGAVLSAESGVRDGEFLARNRRAAGRRGEGAEAGESARRVIVDREWLADRSHTERCTSSTADAGRVRAFRREYLRRDRARPSTRSHPTRAQLPRSLREAYVARGWSEADEQLARRMRFADLPLDARAARARDGRPELR